MKLTKDDFRKVGELWEWRGYEDRMNQILKNQEYAEKWNTLPDEKYKEYFEIILRLKKRIQEVEKEGTIRDLKFYNELQNILGDKNE